MTLLNKVLDDCYITYNIWFNYMTRPPVKFIFSSSDDWGNSSNIFSAWYGLDCKKFTAEDAYSYCFNPRKIWNTPCCELTGHYHYPKD